MSNQDTATALIAALQGGDMELAAGKLSDDFTLVGFVPQSLSLRELLVLQSELLDAMPDFSYNLSDVQEQADGVVQSLIAITGTQTGELTLRRFGLDVMPPTGISVILPQVRATFHCQNARVTRIEVEDVPGGGLVGLVQQIGVELPVAPREENLSM